MKTKTRNSKRSYLMQLFLVALALFTINTAWAFKASYTYSIGSSGQVTFTSTSTGTSASTVYYWYAGDGSSQASGMGMTTYKHTYAYNGLYNTALYIYDSLNNLFDSTNVQINITNSAACNVNASYTASYSAGGLVTFTNTSTGTTGATTYSWYFGDGGSSSAQNPSYTYANNGVYYCYLTATNGAGCSSTVEDSIGVTSASGNPCNLTANFTDTVGVNGHVTFASTTTGINGYAIYNWSAGDGTGNTNYGSSTYSHVYTANGTYYAKLIVYSDSSSCLSLDSIAVVVNNITTPCMLSASFTSVVNAHGQVVYTSTSANTNAGTEYFWNPGDGSPVVLGGPTFTHTYVYQGNYYPWLTIRDTGSAYCVDSTYEYASVYTADSNQCHLVGHFTYALGVNGHVAFNNTSTTINTTLNSTWNFGDGGSDYTSSRNDSHVYTANGTYTVSLITYADSSLCMDSLTQVITISNVIFPCTLSASFSISNDTTTGMVYVSSTSTGTYGSTQYSWRTDNDSSSLGTSTGSSTNLTFPANGSYTVWLIVENPGSSYCIDSIAETVNVSNVDSLHASFTTSNVNDTLGNYLYYFTSTSTGVNGVTMYRWDAGDTTAADSGIGMTNYQHTYMYAGTHIATLSIWFTQYPSMPHPGSLGVNNRYDFSTYSMPIDVGVTGIASVSNPEAEFKLYPNPNNGTFRVAIGGIENSQNAELQITNILGEVIYTTQTRPTNGMILQDISLPSVNSGTYFVRVITADKVYNTKTVITR